MILWLILIWTIVFACLSFLSQKFQYWHWKDIKTLRLNQFIGNWSLLDSMHHTTILQELYDRFKTTDILAGFYIYTNPVAVILDLDLIKSVLIKDCNKFAPGYKNDKDLLSVNLSFTEIAKWQHLRDKLTSTFTPAKIKYVFPTMEIVAQRLNETFADQTKSEQIFNISDLSARFTIDTIASCIFGTECNSFKDPHNECQQIASKITGTRITDVRWQLFMQTYVNVIQCMGLNVTLFPKCINDVLLHSLEKRFKKREQLSIMHNDLLDHLFDSRNTQDEEGTTGSTHNEIAARLFILFLGGYETSSAAISYALYELARLPGIQKKVRQEILSTLKEHNDEFSYETISEMPYLQQIISETIRLYPIAGYLERTATEDYPIPNSDLVLDKGTTVFIPIHSIHYDREIYDYPEQFRPERFHPSEVALRHPLAFFGFGDEPQNSGGLSWARMQVVVALVSLLSQYRFSVCQKTVGKIEFSQHAFTLRSLDDVWLRVDKLEVT